MSLISKVSISGFRSIAATTLDDLADVNALVGRNSSGKSNILRALNLFFNDETEPGRRLDFEADLHAPLRRSKKRRQIVVEVELRPPTKFKVHSSIGWKRSSATSCLTVRRTWRLDQRREVVSVVHLSEDGVEVDRAETLAPMLLRLVRFRYVPNRASPADLLATESPVLVTALAKRLGRLSAGDFLEKMSAAAAQLLSGTDRSLRRAGAPFERIFLDTPGDVADLLRVTGFRALDMFGADVPASAWGYGHQAFFLYHVLREADLDYSRSFGWRQATIWALEEPEAGLHKDLAASLARLLVDWSRDSRNRLQVLYSTHSPAFAQQSDVGFWVEAEKAGSTASREPGHRLQMRAEREGVAHSSHPTLAFQDLPLVVVEGRTDANVLQHASQVLGFAKFRYLDPRSIDPSASAGVDGLIGLLRASRSVRAARVRTSPLVAIVDWEISDQKLKEAQDAYGGGGTVCVVRAPATFANPKLGTDFRGIERFYPESILATAIAADEVQIARHDTRPWTVSASELRRAKGLLAARLCAVTEKEPLRFLGAILAAVDDAVRRYGDSYIAVRANGAVQRTTEPLSTSVLESRSDPIVDVAWGSLGSSLIMFTNKGSVIKVPVDDLDFSRPRAIAELEANLRGHVVVGIFSTDGRSTEEFAYEKPNLGKEYEEPYPHFIAATNRGRAVRLTLWSFVEAEARQDRSYVRLNEGEEVIGLVKVYAEDLVGLATRAGNGIAFLAQDLNLRVRPSAPTRAIALKTNDRVHSIFVCDANTRVIPPAGPARQLPTLRASNIGGRGEAVFPENTLRVRRPLSKSSAWRMRN